MSDLHQPEQDAAAYVTGVMGRRHRLRFEGHLLECEVCWEEVRLDREGRISAEAGRGVAPPELREAVRAAVAAAAVEGLDRTVPSRRPGRRSASLVPAIAAALAAAVLAVSILTLGTPAPEPPSISAALVAYEHSAAEGVHADMPIPDLSMLGLHPMGAEHMALAATPVDAFAYRTDTGSRLVLFMAHVPFPRAVEVVAPSRTWRAEREGMAMLSASAPTSYLAVTSDTALMDRLAGGLASGQVVINA